MRGGDSVTHQLTKKLQHLKKKIKQFEEQFEKERNYKVQMEISDWQTIYETYLIIFHSFQLLVSYRLLPAVMMMIQTLKKSHSALFCNDDKQLQI